MVKKRKKSVLFVYFLAAVSILSFLAIMVASFFALDLQDYATSAIFIILGLGLIIVGNVRAVPKMVQNGLTSDETTHILAIFIGILSVATGFFNMFGEPNVVFKTFQGILSGFAIIMIIIETWFAK